VGIGRDGYVFDEFTPIFYLKEKYDLVDSGSFWLSETPQKPSKGWDAQLNRICTWAVLRNKETGESYAHFNTHLDHVGAQARLNSVQIILDKIAELNLPTVCTGDFNVSEGSEVYRGMTAALGDSKYLAPDTMSMGTFNGFDMEGLAGKSPIDFLFVTKDTITPKVYRVVTDLVDGRIPSDHCMIYTDLTLH
jgi:endonuclease/exonuclease/phosphatase family metal-dependent hydrolase